ncbi:MAG: DUF255 domain-containing protein [Armatimonadetes bacterium]|nr:DUF255 domain-containing protein [Armatimonadota bacterium]
MYGHSRKTKYSAVAAVITIVSIMGLAAKALRPLIPAESRLNQALPEEDFFKSTETEDIPWRKFDSDAFAEARRTNKPIILLIGDVCSFAGRQADGPRGFQEKDLAVRIRKGYVPIRLDTSEVGGWSSAYLPFSRAVIGFDPLFQLIILDPNGTPVDAGLAVEPGVALARSWISRQLDRADQVLKNPASSQFLLRHQADLAMMENPATSPSFSDHRDALEEVIDPVYGGLVMNKRQLLQPISWEYLLAQGGMESADKSLRPLLLSSLVDWLDGGFFRQSSQNSYAYIEFDKLARPNAEMALTLALLYQRTQTPIYRFHAIRTFDWLVDHMTQRGLVVPYQMGDEDEVLRSERYSFSPLLLRENFEPAERQWLRQHFGLRAEEDPQLTIRIDSEEVLDSPDFTQYLQRLRKLKSGRNPHVAEQPQADVSCSAVARLLECAWVLGDKKRIGIAGDMVERLEEFRSGRTIGRRPSDFNFEGVCLADYLGYSDAMLWDYLVFGRAESLLSGRTALIDGLNRFAGTLPGEYLASRFTDTGAAPQFVPSPSLTDDLGESALSSAVRLLGYYQALDQIGVTARVAGSQPQESLPCVPNLIVDRFASIANEMRIRVSGFYLNSLRTKDGIFAVSTGPNASQLANRVRIDHPDTIIVTSFGGEAGPKMKTPGLYGVHHGQVVGPMTPEKLSDWLIRARH